jgi:hypothetical protein
MNLTTHIRDVYNARATSIKHMLQRIDYPSIDDLLGFGARFIGYALVGVAAGACTGELLDRLPYTREVLPHAAVMFASLHGSDERNDELVHRMFYGDLDKLGALTGFVVGAGMSTKERRKRISQSHDTFGG